VESFDPASYPPYVAEALVLMGKAFPNERVYAKLKHWHDSGEPYWRVAAKTSLDVDAAMDRMDEFVHGKAPGDKEGEPPIVYCFDVVQRISTEKVENE